MSRIVVDNEGKVIKDSKDAAVHVGESIFGKALCNELDRKKVSKGTVGQKLGWFKQKKKSSSTDTPVVVSHTGG